MQVARIHSKDGFVTGRVNARDVTRAQARAIKQEGGHFGCDECAAEVLLHADENGLGLHFASKKRGAHDWKCRAAVTEQKAKPADKVHRAILDRLPIVWNLRMGALRTAPDAGTQPPPDKSVPQDARIVTVTSLDAMNQLRRQIRDANALNDPYNPPSPEYVRFRGKRTERLVDRVIRRDAVEIGRLLADIMFCDPNLIPMPYFFALHMRPVTPADDAAVIKAYDAGATDVQDIPERWISKPVRLAPHGVAFCLMDVHRRSIVMPFNQVRLCVRVADDEATRDCLRRGADLLEHKKVTPTPVRMVSVLDESRIRQAIALQTTRPSLHWGYTTLEIDIPIHDGVRQMASDPKSWRETHLAGRNTPG